MFILEHLDWNKAFIGKMNYRLFKWKTTLSLVGDNHFLGEKPRQFLEIFSSRC